MAHHFNFADVAELADALDLGSSAHGVGVRLPSSAPYFFFTLANKYAGVVELADTQDLKSCGW
jgi:hypothetical protein